MSAIRPNERGVTRRSAVLFPATSTALTLVLTLGVTPPVHAQVVRGQVLQVGTDEPVSAVGISILDAEGESLGATVSDDDGRFMLGTRDPGEYHLRAERLGFRSVTTEPLALHVDSIVQVVIRMATEAIALDPLEVVGRRRSEINRATFEGLYQRRARSRRMDFDRVYVRGDQELNDVMTVGEFIRWNGGAHQRMGRCRPAVLYRGTQVPLRLIPFVMDLRLYELEGIEFYRRIENAPPDLRPTDGACAVMVVWPRRRGDEPW